MAVGDSDAASLIRKAPIPPIALLTAAYCVVAVGVSFLISLKEVRFLIAVVPMLALSIALAVDWGGVWAQARSRRRGEATG